MNCCSETEDKKDKQDFLSEELTIRKLLFSHGLVWDSNISTREKLKLILRSNLFHIIVIVLVIIDVICVAVELTLLIEHGKSKHDDMDTVEKVFKYISLSILSIFMIEITIKILVLRKEILKSIAEIFDILVVVVSFVLDIVFIFHHDTSKFPIELLSVLRLWRIIRIINSVIVVIRERAVENHRRNKDEIKKLKEENEKLKKTLNDNQIIIDIEEM